ncbi:hypothetical protein BaRGS_00019131 [Batillaria attramentaria]|uniref:Uncharacterized protein n=1 Tax=Batillaria attramentaria TaxID=370345 RepID=A0ABD0KRI9_9CAEN
MCTLPRNAEQGWTITAPSSPPLVEVAPHQLCTQKYLKMSTCCKSQTELHMHSQLESASALNNFLGGKVKIPTDSTEWK